MRSVLAALVLATSGAASAQSSDAYWQNVERNRQLQRQTELMEQQAEALKRQADATEAAARESKRQKDAAEWAAIFREDARARRETAAIAAETAALKRENDLMNAHEWLQISRDDGPPVLVATDTIAQPAKGLREFTYAIDNGPGKLFVKSVVVSCKNMVYSAQGTTVVKPIIRNSLMAEARRLACRAAVK